MADPFRALLDDPNLRIRLSTARRVLSEDAADTQAIAVAAESLAAPSASIRKAATALMAEFGTAFHSILPSLRTRLETEMNPDIRGYLVESIEAIEPANQLE